MIKNFLAFYIPGFLLKMRKRLTRKPGREETRNHLWVKNFMASYNPGLLKKINKKGS